MAADTARLPEGDIGLHGIDHEGRGVGRWQGKAVFVAGALPGETVRWRLQQDKKSFALGEMVQIHRASAQRVVPPCSLFARCGGCALQHVAAEAQVALKQRVWEEQMQRLGGGMPQQLLPPIYGQPWHYRQRARLSVGKTDRGAMTMGFLARGAKAVVDMDVCLVLPEMVSAALPRLKQHLAPWQDTIGLASISFSDGEDSLVWVLQHRHALSDAALAALQALAADENKHQGKPWHWYAQHQGRLTLLSATAMPALCYRLPEFGITIAYRPDDFTQINRHTNALMVQRAMQWLAPQPGERMVDAFCGLGNFSLPMARLGAQVLGIEGVADMVAQAQANAAANGLAAHCRFAVADLFAADVAMVQQWGIADKWLLDPPRAGAYALVQALAALPPVQRPRRLVYVSCNPATLARDAAVLAAAGYVFRAGGIMNMFAQTAHVESLAVFDLAGKVN